MLSSASVHPSALRETVHHSMSKMQLPWKKNPCLSFPPGAGDAPEHHCMIPMGRLGTVLSAGTMGGVRDGMGEGRERKSWIICTRKYIASTCGFVNFWCGCCPGQAMSLLSVSISTFLYLSVYWLKFLKMIEKRVDKSGILFSISLHPYFMEEAGVLSNLVKHVMETVSQHSPYEIFHFQIYLLPALGSCTVVPQTANATQIPNVISSSASCVMGKHEQMFYKASPSSLHFLPQSLYLFQALSTWSNLYQFGTCLIEALTEI